MKRIMIIKMILVFLFITPYVNGSEAFLARNILPANFYFNHTYKILQDGNYKDAIESYVKAIKVPRNKLRGILLREELIALSSPPHKRGAGYSRAAIKIEPSDLDLMHDEENVFKKEYEQLKKPDPRHINLINTSA